MKTLVLLLLAISLGGCASMPEFLENRVVCTVAKDKAFVVSQWGPIGITGEIAEKDQKVLCEKAS